MKLASVNLFFFVCSIPALVSEREAVDTVEPVRDVFLYL